MPSRTHILLVEDNELDVELARLVFEERGLLDRLAVVRDGQEALDYLRREGSFLGREEDQPALVLLDLNMPRVNGFQVLGAVKSDPALRHVPIVVFTTSSTEPDRATCAELGADGYLTKPSNFDAFLSTVHNLTQTWLPENAGLA